MSNNSLVKALELAINDEWDASHKIVQEIHSNYSNWIHAVLHKIEGDESNSRYWYAQTNHEYDEYQDPLDELRVIQSELTYYIDQHIH
ncbi:hypothetical protein N9O82_02550 [Methylophilaceae bacterium]|nr:hypothetical protein [Methylophilaceae bacterium]